MADQVIAARKRAPRVSYSNDLRDSISEMKISLVELKTSVSGRLDLLEKRQDAFEKREEERRKAEEEARKAKPEQAWNHLNVIGMYVGIAASIVLSIALHFAH